MKQKSTRTNWSNHFLQLAAGLCLVLSPLASKAQADIHFSQFYETSILRNPALIGVFEDDYKLGAFYRTQWSSISHPYVTGVFSAETHFSASKTSDDFFSFGMLGYVDKAGSIDYKISAFYPAINYNKSIDPNHNTYLSVGFTGGYVQYSFDPSKSTFNNQFIGGLYQASNPSMENIPSAKLAMWDMGGGVSYNTSRGENNRMSYVFGASGYHFSQPILSYFHNPKVSENIRWNGSAAMSCMVNDNISFQLQGNYALQGTYNEIIGGGMVNWTQVKGMENLFVISAGCYYRVNDAFIPVVKVKYKTLSAALSYDVNTSTLSTASNSRGGTEFTVFFTGNYSDKSAARKTVCPKF